MMIYEKYLAFSKIVRLSLSVLTQLSNHNGVGVGQKHRTSINQHILHKHVLDKRGEVHNASLCMLVTNGIQC